MNYYIEPSDKRNQTLQNIMREKGYSVFSLDEKNGAEESSDIAYIFSPAKKFCHDEIDSLKNGATLFCGNLGEEAKAILAQKNINYINFMDDKAFALKNARLTAEGVLCLSIEKTSKSIFECKILVLGNGKCGKEIAGLFEKLGLDFVVACRNTNSENCYPVMNFEVFPEKLCEFDLIVNTVPSKIIEDKYLSSINKKTVFIEVASLPCLDKQKAEFLYITAAGLPQVYCPHSAAQLLFEQIEQSRK